MSLVDWERNGWLRRPETSPTEVRELLAIADRDLADSRVEGLRSAWLPSVHRTARLGQRSALVSHVGAGSIDEWEAPSRFSTHPCLRRCCSSAVRFTQPSRCHARHRQEHRAGRPRDDPGG